MIEKGGSLRGKIEYKEKKDKDMEKLKNMEKGKEKG